MSEVSTNTDTAAQAPPADPVKIKQCELVLMLPLLLHDGSADSGEWLPSESKPLLQSWVQWMEHPEQQQSGACPWVRSALSMEGESGEIAARRLRRYSEYVYFHPFVRSLLYSKHFDGDQGEGEQAAFNRNLQRLVRRGFNKLKVVLSDQSELTLLIADPDAPVDSEPSTTHQGDHQGEGGVELFLFDSRVGIAVLRLMTVPGEDISLAQFLGLQDTLRRAYVPYWSPSSGPDGSAVWQAGHSPHTIRLYSANSEPICEIEFGSEDLIRQHLDTTQKSGEPYLLPIWQRMLLPLKPWTGLGAKPPRIAYEQLADDRIPIMAYLAVDDPRRISEGDWLRLAGVDEAGDSNQLPYSSAFHPQENPLREFALDRFWEPNSANEKRARDYSTRWLCCGYGFHAVGLAGEEGFFQDEVSGALAHFRHHYFLLGLLVHSQRAALLRFEHRMADAINALHGREENPDARDIFQQELNKLEVEFLKFRNQHWFHEISGHLQAQELYGLWSKHLHLQELFQEVSDQLAQAAEIVERWNERLQSDSQGQLAVVATGFVLVQLAIEVVNWWLTPEISSPTRFWVSILVPLCAVGLFVWLLMKAREVLKCFRWLQSVPRSLGVRGGVLLLLGGLTVWGLNSRPVTPPHGSHQAISQSASPNQDHSTQD